MRKVFSGIWATIIALSVETSVFVACPAAGCNYVDANGDGICDYYAAGQCGGMSRGHGHGCRGRRCR